MNDLPDLPYADDLVFELLRIVGVNSIIIATIMVIYWIAYWVRFGQHTVKISAAAIEYINSQAEAAKVADPDAWLRRKRAGLFVRLSLVQIFWVVLIYLGVRLAIGLPLIMSSDTNGENGDWSGWKRLLDSTVSFPIGPDAWTGTIAFAAIGVLIALNWALLTQSVAAVKVAKVFVGVAAVIGVVAKWVCGVGGMFLLAIAFLMGAAGGLHTLAWGGTWLTVILLAGMGWMLELCSQAILYLAEKAFSPNLGIAV